MSTTAQTLSLPGKEALRHGLFFAVLIPSPESTQFTACLESFRKIYPFQCRPIAQDRLHLSLYPICRGADLPDEEIQAAIMAGDEIRFDPFALTFSRALTYRSLKPRAPFVVAAQDGLQDLERLRFQIGREHSRIFGIRNYRHRPISPHVTLAWDRMVVPENPIEPITIVVRDFALVHSHIGFSKYDILKRWSGAG